MDLVEKARTQKESLNQQQVIDDDGFDDQEKECYVSNYDDPNF
jgi:hypothetical protein